MTDEEFAAARARARSVRPGRRSFLIGSVAVAGGVAFGVLGRPDSAREAIPEALRAAAGGAPDGGALAPITVMNPWLVIDAEGITVITPRAEMGQGVHTTLAALVAEELDVPWERVRARHGPTAEAYVNTLVIAGGLPFAEYARPRWQDAASAAFRFVAGFVGEQITGGSTSTREAFVTLRRAGASARATLLAAAAERLGADVATLGTADGAVIAPDGSRLDYAALAPLAATLPVPADPPLRSPADWRHLGRSLPRLDMLAKCDGSARYAIDTRLDGMLYATVRMSPRLGGEMIAFEASAAESMPGVERIVDLGDGIGVIASGTWQAFRAAAALAIEWGPAPYPEDSAALHAAIGQAFDEPPNSSLRDEGDVSRAVEEARTGGGAADGSGGGKAGVRVLEAEYRVPWLAHATMEPMNATARLGEDGLELWVGSQAPSAARKRAAAIAGIAPERVTVHVPFLGGGFGRRVEHDVSDQAVRLAMAVPGRAVKLTWTREEDVRHDFYRPAAIARCTGVVDASGPRALRLRIAAPSVYRKMSERLVGTAPPGPDKLLVEGAFDQPYRIANYEVHGHPSEVAVPIGSWRSVGYSHNTFFHECFLDELAAAAGLDPLAMRLTMMEGVHEPSRRCLSAVGEMAGWAAGALAGRARGVAFCHSFGSPAAHVVEVGGAGSAGEPIRVERVWCAIEVGTALDVRNIEAQLVSGTLFGLSAALFGGISFAGGEVREGNFDDQRILRLHETPEIETQVLASGGEPGGVGEPGTPSAIAALANAVFALSGTPVRELPLSARVEAG